MQVYVGRIHVDVGGYALYMVGADDIIVVNFGHAVTYVDNADVGICVV